MALNGFGSAVKRHKVRDEAVRSPLVFVIPQLRDLNECLDALT